MLTTLRRERLQPLFRLDHGRTLAAHTSSAARIRRVLLGAPPEDRAALVEGLVEALRATMAGSEARRDLIRTLLAVLRTPSSRRQAKAVARAFVGAEGPEVLHDIESCMRGDWIRDAKNGTLSAISDISKLPGAVGTALAGYRAQKEYNKQAAANGACSHPEHRTPVQMAQEHVRRQRGEAT